MVICAYAAASDRIDDIYKTECERLGSELAKKGHSLVYGGGAGGLMGAFSKGMVNEGAKVTGIVPSFMKNYEAVRENCTEFIEVATMSDRKDEMEARAECFLILPGGIGTYDEFFQILVLKSLDQKKTPIVIFNLNGYYEPLKAIIADGIQKGFIDADVSGLYRIRDTVEDILDMKLFKK